MRLSLSGPTEAGTQREAWQAQPIERWRRARKLCDDLLSVVCQAHGAHTHTHTQSPLRGTLAHLCHTHAVYSLACHERGRGGRVVRACSHADISPRAHTR